MKTGLGLAALTVVLASCGSSVSSGSDLYVDTSSLQLSSGYGVQNANFQGQSYSGPAICDNVSTPLNASFNYTGTVTSVDIRMKGSQGATSSSFDNVQLNDSGSTISIDFSVGSGVAPLSVHKQGIIVVPQPNVIGATKVQLVAHSPSGQTDILSTNYLPVVDNCN